MGAEARPLDHADHDLPIGGEAPPGGGEEVVEDVKARDLLHEFSHRCRPLWVVPVDPVIQAELRGLRVSDHGGGKQSPLGRGHGRHPPREFVIPGRVVCGGVEGAARESDRECVVVVVDQKGDDLAEPHASDWRTEVERDHAADSAGIVVGDSFFVLRMQSLHIFLSRVDGRGLLSFPAPVMCARANLRNVHSRMRSR